MAVNGSGIRDTARVLHVSTSTVIHETSPKILKCTRGLPFQNCADPCPICAVATACTGLCRMELEIFPAALGEDVMIERVEHILASERRCVYQVAQV